MELPDRLKDMFDLQRALMLRLGAPLEKTGNLNDREVQMEIRLMTHFMVEELHEATHHLKLKPWKTHADPINRTEFTEELIDAWHFFLEILILSGVSPAELYDRYCKKNQVNHTRQDEGY